MVALVQRKLNSFNWNMASKIGIILLDISIICMIAHLALNTKSMDNSTIIFSYLIIGLLIFPTMKMNNETISDSFK